jgi:hypothetical protein
MLNVMITTSIIGERAHRSTVYSKADLFVSKYR